MSQDQLHQFILDKKTHQRIGVLVARRVKSNDNEIKIAFGWSLCHSKFRKPKVTKTVKGEGQRKTVERTVEGGFVEQHGIDIAEVRAIDGCNFKDAPPVVQRNMPKFVGRALRYWKIEVPTKD